MINEHLLTLLAQADARSFSSSPSADPCGSTAWKQSRNQGVGIAQLPLPSSAPGIAMGSQIPGAGRNLKDSKPLFLQLRLAGVTVLGWDMMNISVTH